MDNSKNLIQLWSNDAKRKAFLEAYKDWGEWLCVPELDLVFYRYTLPCGDTIIAMEHNQRNYRRSAKGDWETGIRYYQQKKDTPFTPLTSSIWAVADLLKNEKIRLQQEVRPMKANKQ